MFLYVDPLFAFQQVVDMLYFPLISTTYPSWMPYLGGKPFEFFEPVFNIADASISVGVIVILLFQNTFFKKEDVLKVEETTTGNEDIVQAS